MTELTCPKCRETRLMEIIHTASKREAFCAVCSFHWPFVVQVCSCGEPQTPHYHADVNLIPPCPKCGKAAQMSKPA